ncbi:MAG: heparan-alpha-glucosaminide N-acetyltransferase domain-containing protein [Polyangiaceae bacterium]
MAESIPHLTLVPEVVVPRVTERVQSIDVLRGTLMALMALGHTRHFLSDSLEFAPTNLQKTSTALFLTRWITHFCAPGFVLLAGAGVYLLASSKSRAEASRFLALRGLWLIFLELVVVRCLGWSFNFGFAYVMLGVLWAIGWSMLALAALIRLRVRSVVAFGVALIALHNAFDGVRSKVFGSFGWVWSVLHRTVQLEPIDGMRVKVGYPLIPWIGILAVGYGVGALLKQPREVRKRILTRLGLGLIACFLLVRGINVYGDPRPWAVQSSFGFTIFSFLNCDKYPPSLAFVLMTFGPLLLALAWLDRDLGPLATPLAALGRVPLFYYLLHIPLIHAVAVVLALLRYGHARFLFQDPPGAHGPPFPLPDDYGYSLPWVYVIWLGVVAVLVPLCIAFGQYKRASRSVWLSYLL